MKFKLLFSMIALMSFSTTRPNIVSDIAEIVKTVSVATVDVAKDSFYAVKENTWDLKIGKVENGGKIIVSGIVLALIADQIYCWHVNKQYKKTLQQMRDGKLSYKIDEEKGLFYVKQ
jgi:cellobiose-specific phosphotransferase system component IIC